MIVIHIAIHRLLYTLARCAQFDDFDSRDPLLTAFNSIVVVGWTISITGGGQSSADGFVYGAVDGYPNYTRLRPRMVWALEVTR